MTPSTAPRRLIHSIVQQLNKILPLPFLTPPWRAHKLTTKHTEYLLAKCQTQTHVYVTNLRLLQQTRTVKMN